MSAQSSQRCQTSWDHKSQPEEKKKKEKVEKKGGKRQNANKKQHYLATVQLAYRAWIIRYVAIIVPIHIRSYSWFPIP
jgi:hypothetical protein